MMRVIFYSKDSILFGRYYLYTAIPTTIRGHVLTCMCIYKTRRRKKIILVKKMHQKLYYL